jgi:hypothetical protein
MTEEMGRSKQKEYLAKGVLTFVFLGGFAAFTGWMLTAGPGLDGFQPTWIELFILGFATYRLGRLIAYDRVMEPFRQFFTTTGPDPTGAGDSVSPKGQGFQQSIGQLICCPICAGTWIAALLTYLLILFPGPARVFLTMTTAIAIAELLGAVTEAASWGGQYARTAAGEKNIEREELRSGHAVSFPERKPSEHVDESYRDYR